MSKSCDASFINAYKKLDPAAKRDFQDIILQNNLSSNFLRFARDNNFEDLIEDTFLNNLKLQKTRYQIHSLAIVMEIHQINELFKDEGLTPIYLKGVATQKEYDDIALRPLTDIDILLKRSEILEAYEILHRNNFLIPKEKKYLDNKNINQFCKNFHHIQLISKNNISIELHHRTTLPSDFDDCPISKFFFEDFRTINYYGKKINIPSIENTIIHQLTHFSLQSDFRNLLRTMNDIRMINKNYEINWHEVILKSKNTKIRRSICLPLEVFNKNNIAIRDLELIKSTLEEYFPEKELLAEAQDRIFRTNQRTRDDFFYSEIFMLNRLLTNISRVLIPDKIILIYKYKISKPNFFSLFKAYLINILSQLFKLRGLPFFLIKKIFNLDNIKYTNSVSLWLNKNQ